VVPAEAIQSVFRKEREAESLSPPETVRRIRAPLEFIERRKRKRWRRESICPYRYGSLDGVLKGKKRE